jgi:gamma-glutamyltranspeptidase/glutathione hydrolase
VLRLVVVVLGSLLAGTPHAGARGGAVAGEHRFAAEAGATILRRGGSAADAAIAAAAAGCVVHASSCGLGGGGFALVRLANGDSAALDFREHAPAGATADRFLENGRPSPERSQRGGLAVAVPGEVAGWVALHDRFGRLPLSEILDPAVRLAREGFRLDEAPHLRAQIERHRPALATDAGLRAVFLEPGGAAPGPAFRVMQPDLARTLQGVGARGAGEFYGGKVASAIVAAVQRAGGVLDARDLASYAPLWRGPLVASFRGRTVITFPPPGSGGVMLEALGILGRAQPADDASWYRLLGGAMAYAFFDRARWYGDPAFTHVPLGELLAPARLAQLAALLRAGTCPAEDAAVLRDAGTANVSVVDTDGNAVVLTTTINTAFGSGIMAPGTGVILNNEMDDFAIAPGVPNVYGLVGTAANAVAPGKRPQSSMAPTIVLRGSRPELAVGGSGGAFIISGILQVMLGVVVAHRDLTSAVVAPRIHDQGVPPVLLVEPGIPARIRDRLELIQCHRVRVLPDLGAVSAAGLGGDGAPAAAGDPRKDGGAVVVP